MLSRLELRPRVLFFPTLLGERLREFLDFFGRWKPYDLERHWMDREEPDDDPETGRPHDEGLEPFVPFGLLVQLELWPEAGVGRKGKGSAAWGAACLDGTSHGAENAGGNDRRVVRVGQHPQLLPDLLLFCASSVGVC